ncbi:uncharacterized protein [Palaemon carinicauda]|uniref:uncharacterized protein n=1 Tax=Palaemon carinicauda TaxID=392227 RepID=UPI0035B5FE94
MCCGGEILNIISAYAPQVVCAEEKGNFWRDMDGVMQELEEQERVIVRTALNGHVGRKGDVQECGNYRAIKLMSHTLTILEWMINARLREEVEIDSGKNSNAVWNGNTSIRKTEEKKMDVAEMRMLRWMSGVSREDLIKNDYIRWSTKVVEISKKVQEGRLRWYGHLMRRDEDHVGRHTMKMEVQGRRRRGRPRKRWRDCVRGDLQEKEIDEAEAQNRKRWTWLIWNGNPI